MRLIAPLLCVALASAPFVAADDDVVLKENKVTADGPSLVKFFEKRSGDDVSDAALKRLVVQLGDDDYFRRQQASEKLFDAGPRARALLGAAVKHDDPEVRLRARRCLDRIQERWSDSLDVVRAAVRVLAARQPDGAADALLKYLARAEDASVEDEIHFALAGLAVRDGKADAVLLAALADKSAVKRGAAAVALCRAKATDQLPALRKLLADEDVRLGVAVALAVLGEKDAVGVLIEHMDGPPTPELGAAEDILFRLAGEQSPHLESADADQRKRYRRAWETWWKDAKAKADLRVLTEASREPGHTTVVLLDDGQVVDLDAAGKQRWAIGGLQMPLDLQRLTGERVLIAEHDANRVAERDSKGGVPWEKRVIQPVMAQRLPNGNTFIAAADRAFEITPLGKEVFSYAPQAGRQIMRAVRAPGGDVIVVTKLKLSAIDTPLVTRLDRFGRPLGDFFADVATSGGRLGMTPAGNLLVPEMYNNRVQERGRDGMIVRQIVVDQPITAYGLPNGNVLVTSMTGKRAAEFDRAGKEVWEYKRDTRVTRAVRP